jgi:hypothetical protein
LVDHLLKDLLGGLKVIPRPIEHFFADGLFFLIMEVFKIRVVQALFDGVAVIRVEGDHF